MSIHVDYMLAISELPAECIEECSAIGDVTEAVDHWRRELNFTVDRDRAIACLQGYSYEPTELAASDDDEIAARVLWIACGDFRQWDGTDSSPCGSDIFVLE